MTSQVPDSVCVHIAGPSSTGSGAATLDGRVTVNMSSNGNFTTGMSFVLLQTDSGIFNNTFFRSESINYYNPAGPCIIPRIAYDAFNVKLVIDSCVSVGGGDLDP